MFHADDMENDMVINDSNDKIVSDIKNNPDSEKLERYFNEIYPFLPLLLQSSLVYH